MGSSLLTIITAVTLGQLPVAPYGGEPYGAPGMAANGFVPAGVYAAGDSTHAFNSGDPLYPFDAIEPWVHGHWQEIPSYGGFHSYRPYNYKHVLSQSQVAGGWGMSPNMPYSQDYFRRIREQMMSQQAAMERGDAYRAELAKLRARQENEGLRMGRNSIGSERRNRLEQRYPAQVVGGETYSGENEYVDPADFARQSRLESLQRQIEAQSFELQRLQRQVRDEYSSAP